MTTSLPERPAEATSVRVAAQRLMGATRDHAVCAPVRDVIGATDVTTAYAVQDLVNQARLSAGARVVGRKIGLTAAAVRAQLGVDRPDFGVLFADMDRSSGADAVAEVPLRLLLQPKVEAEIAFVLSTDLIDGPFDEAQVAAAVAVARPALEIVDSRIANWDITFADTVADNGSSGLFVLGEAALRLAEFVPVDALMEMTHRDDVVSSGSGAACLGDPLAALAWLAQTARDVGAPLRAGEVVLSGALGPMVAVTQGGDFTADISGLGSVSVSFTTGDST